MQHLEGLRTLSFAALENQQQTSDQEGFEGGGKGLSRDDRREVGTHGGGRGVHGQRETHTPCSRRSPRPWEGDAGGPDQEAHRPESGTPEGRTHDAWIEFHLESRSGKSKS